MTDTTRPGDPADRATDAKADGAFQGSHRAGYGDRLARVEDWLRKHPDATLQSGEGAVLIQEIDQLRRQILIFVDMAATWVKVGHENERLQDAIDRVRALHAPQEYTIWSGARLQRCTHCRDESGYCLPHPCPTIRALDGDA